MTNRFQGVHSTKESADAQLEHTLARIPGAAVFPLHGVIDGACGCGDSNCGNVGKHPLLRWSKVTAGQQEFGRDGHAICTGARSGVFDVETDQKPGVDGEANLRALGTLPRTFTFVSPSGSRHRIYRMRTGRVTTVAGRIAEGVDTRGDGGIAVLPGSPHRKGGVYRIEDDTNVADAPDWLWELVVEKEREQGNASSGAFCSAILSPEEFDTLLDAISATDPGPGKRNEWRLPILNILLNDGHSADSTIDLAAAIAVKIGANESEFMAIARSCFDAKGRGAPRKGWRKLRALVGDDKANAIRDAINPRERELGARMQAALRKHTKAEKGAALDAAMAHLRQVANDVHERQANPAEEDAQIAWETLDVGDGVELSRLLDKHLEDVVFTDGAFYRYNPRLGVWCDAEGALRRHLFSMSGLEIGSRSLKMTESLEKYALSVFAETRKDDEFFASAVPGIACPNGFLRVAPEGAELVPHAKEHRARVPYHLDYDPEADRTKWDAFTRICLNVFHALYRCASVGSMLVGVTLNPSINRNEVVRSFDGGATWYPAGMCIAGSVRGVFASQGGAAVVTSSDIYLGARAGTGFTVLT